MSLGLLLMVVAAAGACDRDPYRIGVELQTDGRLTIHFAPCGENVAVKRVAISRSGLKRAPVWEIRSENPDGERVYEFPVGEAPEGFDLTMPMTSGVGGGAFVIVDSSFLEGQSYSFEPSELRPGLVLAGNARYLTAEEFRGGALCGDGRFSGGLIGLIRDHPWAAIFAAFGLVCIAAVALMVARGPLRRRRAAAYVSREGG